MLCLNENSGRGKHAAFIACWVAILTKICKTIKVSPSKFETLGKQVSIYCSGIYCFLCPETKLQYLPRQMQTVESRFGLRCFDLYRKPDLLLKPAHPQL